MHQWLQNQLSMCIKSTNKELRHKRLIHSLEALLKIEHDKKRCAALNLGVGMKLGISLRVFLLSHIDFFSLNHPPHIVNTRWRIPFTLDLATGK